MATKKELMTCDAKDFVAAMNPKKECKRKSPSTARTVKQRHAKSAD